MFDSENRIRQVRKAKGKTGPELAALVGTTPQQIYRLESGERSLTDQWLIKLANALGCHPIELTVFGKATVDIVVAQFVSDDEGRIFSYESAVDAQIYAHAAGNAGVRSIHVPLEMQSCRAVRVVNNRLWPRYDEGDVILYDPSKPVDLDQCVGNECIIKTGASEWYLRRLLPGGSPAFRLMTSYRASSVDAVFVDSAWPVHFVMRSCAINDYGVGL